MDQAKKKKGGGIIIILRYTLCTPDEELMVVLKSRESAPSPGIGELHYLPRDG